MPVTSPFSRRTSGSKVRVQGEWPQSARVLLLHLLYDLVDYEYVDGWVSIDKEVRWIAREAPVIYGRDQGAASRDARLSAEAILANLPWDKMFDFCERLYSQLATNVGMWVESFPEQSWQETKSRNEVQRYIADELQRIFLEENFGYYFEDGEVRRYGGRHMRGLVAKTEHTMEDPRLNGARQHFAKAQRYFQHPSKPDYENAVKEAVCAVEAAARALFPLTKAKTLGDIIKKIQGAGEGRLPKPLADTLMGLYAYRGAGDGVSHGGADGGKATPAIAEYALAVAASQIILLHEVASVNEEADVPF